MVVGDVLGEVLDEVADAPVASFEPARTPWASNRVAEPGHVQRLVLVAERVEGLVPGRQGFAGGGVDVGARVRGPRRAAGRRRTGGGGVGPPDLVVGGGQHLAQVGAGEVPRMAKWTCGATRRWGSTAAKYWTS